MARPKIRVQHFLACRSVEVEGPVCLDNPYTLRTVKFCYELPPDQEFPTNAADFWIFCRLINENRGIGRVELSVEVIWLDGPRGERLTSYYPGLMVYFREGETVTSRVWRLSRVVFPGRGRYDVRLRSGRFNRLLASEFIQIEQAL